YGALGVSFFLVAYELQVATGWSAFRAGVALLPATALMLVLSATSGELAQRIGPRLQLTAGPLLAGAGLLLLARVGPHASCVAAAAGPLAFIGLIAHVRAPRTARRVHCAIDGAPLQPDPRRCRTGQAGLAGR